jgi:hypothetical protein
MLLQLGNLNRKGIRLKSDAYVQSASFHTVTMVLDL